MLGLGLDGFAIVATIMTLPKPKMMMRLRKERKLSYIRVNTASEFLAGNGDFCLTSTVQAFLDFRDFRFNAVYNSILFSSPLVLLSNLDLRGFRFPQIFYVSPH